MAGIRYERGQRWFLSLGLVLVLIEGGGAAVVAQQSYRLGPNDIVKVQVYGEEDLSVETKIDGGGNITYPLRTAMSSRLASLPLSSSIEISISRGR